MDYELPKRLFIPYSETEAKHINNRYRLATIDKLELLFPNECKDVKKNIVFAHILRVHHNKLNYSERMIHNMLIKQLIWAMEAILAVGKLSGTKLTTDFIAGQRCSNWQGAAKVSCDEIKQLEMKIMWADNIYLYISRTGNGDVVDDIQFLRDEVWEAEERVETSSIHEEQEEEEKEAS
ncbi:hypothetical protein F2Q70_00008953 [Brassica cretica]|uniref:Uncharacterized protein n=1 Tax=Brassica cretica TaxID=69181 RepID=A0A8S9M2M3_BRACR|nr:hypothetical protein F2Q70_00008953 [Brassica cretica]